MVLVRLMSHNVEVIVRLTLKVVDPTALRKALDERDGPAGDDVERALRNIPANCVGRMVDISLLLTNLPGVVPEASSVTVQ